MMSRVRDTRCTGVWVSKQNMAVVRCAVGFWYGWASADLKRHGSSAAGSECEHIPTVKLNSLNRYW